jgi:hypothetical protein
VAAAGGIEAVVAALWEHPGTEAVQGLGCFALTNLVTDHPDNQTAVAAAGGIAAVVAALRAHPAAEAVQENGCYALGNLVHGHPANTTAVVAAGAVDIAAAVCGQFAAGTGAHRVARIVLEFLGQG